MALTKTARNKIFSFVQQAKKLLFEEMEGELQQHFGIRPDGTVLMVEELTSSDPDIIYTAGLLRNRLDYLKSNIPGAGKKKDQEAVRQLVREQAFTILNRFASLRMAEERDIIRETVRQGYNSEGFLTFDSISGESKSADRFTRYKWYILAIFDELAQDLPALYYRFSPYFLLFPGENALLQLLDIINDEDLSIHREPGLQPVNLWKEDETIGWVYQYYNSREEIKAMRAESDSPRNSQELAVRNQFFTPRYVVQFLTDNSLGRIWYEMTRGQTKLAEICEYLVRQPNEVFLQAGETAPKDAGEDTTYIPHRPLKDPREILMLDPACGSMHFGLYAFDLYEQIYLEAWDNHPDLLRDLKDTLFRSEFLKLIPSLIIRHNIHGVDIDPRAVQIAGLSLWLRAQKSYQRLSLQPAERPAITKANLVCAEPMPGNQAMLEEFLRTVDEPLRPLIRTIWDSMKLAGETGMLLKIEEELKNAIAETKEEWAKYKNVKGVQGNLFGKNQPGIQLQMNQLSMYKRLKEDFFEQAEGMVLKALQEYAETATNGSAYQKNLFAEDTARGFAFIDLCRKRYDVVLMNPPFGNASLKTITFYKSYYPNWGKNILLPFLERLQDILNNNGKLGAIFDRTVLSTKSYKNFRQERFCGHIALLGDTGWGVLDANVETTTIILQSNLQYNGAFFDLRNYEDKSAKLTELVKFASSGQINENIYYSNSSNFYKLPNSVIGYDFPKEIIVNFDRKQNLFERNLQVRVGHDLKPEFHYRLYWEKINYLLYKHLYNGGEFSMFYMPTRTLCYWGKEGVLVAYNPNVNLRNQDFHFKKGLGFGKRGFFLDAHILREEFIFTREGLSISNIEELNAFYLLSFLNSSYANYLLDFYTGQHKDTSYVNLLPPPDLTETELHYISKLSKEIISIKLKWVGFDETALEYRSSILSNILKRNLKTSLRDIFQELSNDEKRYSELIKENDDFFVRSSIKESSIKEKIEKYRLQRPIENLWFAKIKDEKRINDTAHSHEILQALFGVIFGRWDVRSILAPSLIPPFGGFFDPLPFMPVVSLKKVPPGYPIAVPEDGILVDDTDNARGIFKAIRKALRVLWKENADNIENELCELGQFNTLEDFIGKHNGFFAYHLDRYTKSRRIAPIYWPLSTPSGSYTVWLYYPRLTDQTLFKVVNDYLDPKLEHLQKDIRELRQAGSKSSELNQTLGLEAELKDFKEKLLRIAQLPYQPNHDDGVLITAAPLHELFPHPKWRKATQECWEKLEAGEYDWAHLAYAIWPERVREKCKTDLSMAIAHGLEDICEVEVKGRKN